MLVLGAKWERPGLPGVEILVVPSKAAGNQPGDAKFGPPQGAIKNVNLEVKQAISFVKRDGWGVNILVVPSKGAGKLMLVLGTKWERLGVKILVVSSTSAGNQMGNGWGHIGKKRAGGCVKGKIKDPPGADSRIADYCNESA